MLSFSSLARSLFQSAPLTGARGDAGCRNQRTIRKLYRYLRESVTWLSIKSDSTLNQRGNLL